MAIAINIVLDVIIILMIIFHKRLEHFFLHKKIKMMP